MRREEILLFVYGIVVGASISTILLVRLLLCRMGIHRWLYYGPFDTRRHCVFCMKRQDQHGDLWTWFDRWL